MNEMDTHPPLPRWQPAGEPGYAEALNSAVTVTAPLLAGASAVLIGVMLDNSVLSGLRFPNAALALILGAAVLFIGCLQTLVSARRFSVTPDQMRMWFEEWDNESWRGDLLDEYNYFRTRFLAWAEATRIIYNAGLLAFLGGVAILLVPAGEVDWHRWAVVAVATTAFGCEAAWIMSLFITVRRARNARTPQNADFHKGRRKTSGTTQGP